MTVEAPHPSGSPRLRADRYRLIATSWVALAAFYLLLAGMVHFRVAHPHFLPVVSILALLVLSSVLAVVAGLYRLVRGPLRRQGIRLLTLGTVPLSLLAAHVCWAVRYDMHERPAHPSHSGYAIRLLLPMAESLIDLIARFRYPQRTIGRHVVMIHAGASHPEAQVEAMDHHIERMERLLGQRAEGKVHWVRGKVFGSLPGAGGFCLFGVAVGTAPGSQELGPDGLAFTDRHEVAHWAISRFFKPYQVLPPTALIEGWAESQSGYSQSRLYGQALSCRQAQTWLPLSRLVIPGEDILYSRVYRQGGVLVDYLLDRYGGPSFFALYHGCTSAGFDADCKRLLDRRLDELEIEYTRHLDDRKVRLAPAVATCRASLRSKHRSRQVATACSEMR